MKNKISLLAVVLAGVVTTNASALEIHKGKIIAHKEWTTGIAKGSFKSKALVKKNVEDMGNFYVYTNAQGGKAQAGIVTTINGQTQVFIQNASNETKQYSYNMSVCSDTTEHTASCVLSFYTIEVEPNGDFSDSSTPELRLIYDKAGKYNTYVNTFVSTNLSSSQGYFQANSSSSSSVEVS